jgi:hypothetical protein
MELTKDQELIMLAAQKGYEGYCRYTGWKSAVTGDTLPEWENLSGTIKNAWFAAVTSALNFITVNTG